MEKNFGMCKMNESYVYVDNVSLCVKSKYSESMEITVQILISSLGFSKNKFQSYGWGRRPFWGFQRRNRTLKCMFWSNMWGLHWLAF